MSKNLAKDISVLLHRAESDPFVAELTRHVAVDLEDLKEAGKWAALPVGAGTVAALLATAVSPKEKRKKRAALVGGSAALLTAAGREGAKHAEPMIQDLIEKLSQMNAARREADLNKNPWKTLPDRPLKPLPTGK